MIKFNSIKECLSDVLWMYFEIQSADNDQIVLVGLPDDLTTEADRLLNYGIVMFNFYAVMWAVRPDTPRWSFEPVTDRDLALPADVEYVAKCKL